MSTLDVTDLFRAALDAEPERLHFAAHSHHLWPDVTRAAHERAWTDAVALADEKWGRFFAEVYPAAQAGVARTLGVADPSQVAFSANTHDLLLRLLSALPGWNAARPLRMLSTDAEFHSFTRQLRRFVESGRVEWVQVPAEPFASLPARFEEASAAGPWDLAFASHVFFSSGHVFDEVFELLAALPEETACVVDGYHGFFAVPTDLGAFSDRLYYLSGGYKYAMAGEGVSFVVAPHGREPRPEFTGWFAGFGSLEAAQGARVEYDPGAARMLGATFEPTAFYRLQAVFSLLERRGITVADIHAHVGALQERFLDRVAAGAAGTLRASELTPGRGEVAGSRRGHFLTFRRDDARALQQRLLAARVVTDARVDRLRFGFGLYHVEADVDRLVARLAQLG
ncbi:MAG: aminotransferase [Planctomycetota bacterium]